MSRRKSVCRKSVRRKCPSKKCPSKICPSKKHPGAKKIAESKSTVLQVNSLRRVKNSRIEILRHFLLPESKIWPWPLGRERQLRVHDCRRQRRRLYLRRHLITVLRPKLWNIFVLTGSGIIYVWKFHLTAGLQFEWFRFSSISYYVQRTTYFLFCKNSIHSNWIPVVQLYFPLQSKWMFFGYSYSSQV